MEDRQLGNKYSPYPGDVIDAKLEPGEYVVNRNAVKAIGKAKLDKLNNEIAPRFQEGGQAKSFSPFKSQADYRANQEMQASMKQKRKAYFEREDMLAKQNRAENPTPLRRADNIISYQKERLSQNLGSQDIRRQSNQTFIDLHAIEEIPTNPEFNTDDFNKVLGPMSENLRGYKDAYDAHQTQTMRAERKWFQKKIPPTADEIAQMARVEESLSQYEAKDALYKNEMALKSHNEKRDASIRDAKAQHSSAEFERTMRGFEADAKMMEIPEGPKAPIDPKTGKRHMTVAEGFDYDKKINDSRNAEQQAVMKRQKAIQGLKQGMDRAKTESNPFNPKVPEAPETPVAKKKRGILDKARDFKRGFNRNKNQEDPDKYNYQDGGQVQSYTFPRKSLEQEDGLWRAKSALAAKTTKGLRYYESEARGDKIQNAVDESEQKALYKMRNTPSDSIRAKDVNRFLRKQEGGAIEEEEKKPSLISSLLEEGSSVAKGAVDSVGKGVNAVGNIAEAGAERYGEGTKKANNMIAEEYMAGKNSDGSNRSGDVAWEDMPREEQQAMAKDLANNKKGLMSVATDQQKYERMGQSVSHAGGQLAKDAWGLTKGAGALGLGGASKLYKGGKSLLTEGFDKEKEGGLLSEASSYLNKGKTENFNDVMAGKEKGSLLQRGAKGMGFLGNMLQDASQAQGFKGADWSNFKKYQGEESASKEAKKSTGIETKPLGMRDDKMTLPEEVSADTTPISEVINEDTISQLQLEDNSRNDGDDSVDGTSASGVKMDVDGTADAASSSSGGNTNINNMGNPPISENTPQWVQEMASDYKDPNAGQGVIAPDYDPSQPAPEPDLNSLTNPLGLQRGGMITLEGFIQQSWRNMR